MQNGVSPILHENRLRLFWRSYGVFSLTRYCRWNKDPSLHFRNKKTVATGAVGRQGDGTVFRDANVMMFIDYLEKVQMISAVYYASLLGMLSEKILFHQNNARVHACKVSAACWNRSSKRCNTNHIHQIWPQWFFLFPFSWHFTSNKDVIIKRMLILKYFRNLHFFWRLKKLWKMYKVERLCWEIKLAEKTYFSIFPKGFMNDPHRYEVKIRKSIWWQ